MAGRGQTLKGKLYGINIYIYIYIYIYRYYIINTVITKSLFMLSFHFYPDLDILFETLTAQIVA